MYTPKPFTREYILPPKMLKSSSTYSHPIGIVQKRQPGSPSVHTKYHHNWYIKSGIVDEYLMASEIIVGELARLFLGNNQPKYRTWHSPTKKFIASKEIPGFRDFKSAEILQAIIDRRLTGLPEALVTLLVLGQDDLKGDNLACDAESRVTIFDFDATVFTASPEEQSRFLFTVNDVLSLPHLDRYQPFNWLDTYFAGSRMINEYSLAPIIEQHLTPKGSPLKEAWVQQLVYQCYKIFLLKDFGMFLIQKIAKGKIATKLLAVYNARIEMLKDIIIELSTLKIVIDLSKLVTELRQSVPQFYIYGKETFPDVGRILNENATELLKLI